MERVTLPRSSLLRISLAERVDLLRDILDKMGKIKYLHPFGLSDRAREQMKIHTEKAEEIGREMEQLNEELRCAVIEELETKQKALLALLK